MLKRYEDKLFINFIEMAESLRIALSQSYQNKTFARLLIVACIVMLSRPCVAGEIDQARAAFSRAVELFGREEYRDALAAFEESYRLYPRHSTLFNLGMCHKALGSYRTAIATFTRFLKEDPESTDPEMRQDASAAVDELMLLVGTLRIRGAPDGAAVTVNGVDADASAPSEPLLLDPGQNSVQITKDGYNTFMQNVTIVAGSETNLDVQLKPQKKERPNVGEDIAKHSPYAEGGISKGRRRAAEEDSRLSPLLLSGILTGGAGLVAAGVGGYFNYQYFVHWNRGKEAANDWDRTRDPIFKEKYRDIANDKLPADKTGIVAGYVCGGVLIAAGIVLIAVDIALDSKEKTGAVTLSPGAGGVVLSF